ncbi:hypothetical protein ACF1GT_17090 [Streptomyces sp. NPDC014636]|uniref:hypothetical protein n=1 Tax=Streptomyces sp. NPDC014636 TaxID=3364876 RepID=UPI0036FD7835
MLVDVSVLGERRREVELEALDEVLEEVRGSDRQRELRLLLSKRNRVAVAGPVVRPFDDVPDPGIVERVGFSDPQFVVLLASVACMPDPACRFTWVRVEVTLGDDVPAGAPRPVACGFFPERTDDRVPEVRTLEWSADLSVEALGIPVGPGLSRTATTTSEVARLQHRVMTFGRFGSQPAWHFAQTSAAPEVTGDLLLSLVIAVPSGVRAGASLTVAAEAELRDVPFRLPLVTHRSGSGLGGGVVSLSVS